MHTDDILPTVSFPIPAYNEEAVIEAKLENSLALDYPQRLLDIVVTSQSSSDRTHQIVERYAGPGCDCLSARAGARYRRSIGRHRPVAISCTWATPT